MIKVVMFVVVCGLSTSLFSACRVYLLPSHCTVNVVGEGDPIEVDSAEICTSVTSNGCFSCPFRVTGYSKGKRLVLNTIYGAHGNVPFDVLLTADNEDSGNDLYREVVRESIDMRDEHYSVSVKKLGDDYFVEVEDLDFRRLRTEAINEVNRRRVEIQEFGELSWPKMDGEYKYRGSREACKPIMSWEKGKGAQNVGSLRAKGALYQIGEKFRIRFAFTHEVTNGVVSARSEGHVVGEIANGEIKDSTIVYDVGEDVVRAQICLVKEDKTDMPHREEMRKFLAERGIRERTIRLRLTYGDYVQDLDLHMELKTSANPSDSN